MKHRSAFIFIFLIATVPAPCLCINYSAGIEISYQDEDLQLSLMVAAEPKIIKCEGYLHYSYTNNILISDLKIKPNDLHSKSASEIMALNAITTVVNKIPLLIYYKEKERQQETGYEDLYAEKFINEWKKSEKQFQETEKRIAGY
jgi:hypothetical protein